VTDGDLILNCEHVTVDYDGFKALNNCNFRVHYNELRVVIGPNGAGKTTLLDVICGKTTPASGKVLFGHPGINLVGKNAEDITKLGVGRKFQAPSVYGNLSVWDNLDLSVKRPSRGVFPTLLGRSSPAERTRIQDTLETIGLTPYAQERAGALSHGQKQWLEIGMLLMQEPQLLLLDEPVAGMTDEETARTAALFKSLAGGHSVVVVEHDMEFIESIANVVTVLHEGSVLAEGTMDVVKNDERVIEVYLGR
jgi:urea transport system ATP-binding protein